MKSQDGMMRGFALPRIWPCCGQQQRKDFWHELTVNLRRNEAGDTARRVMIRCVVMRRGKIAGADNELFWRKVSPAAALTCYLFIGDITNV